MGERGALLKEVRGQLNARKHSVPPWTQKENNGKTTPWTQEESSEFTAFREQKSKADPKRHGSGGLRSTNPECEGGTAMCDFRKQGCLVTQAWGLAVQARMNLFNLKPTWE